MINEWKYMILTEQIWHQTTTLNTNTDKSHIGISIRIYDDAGGLAWDDDTDTTPVK